MIWTSSGGLTCNRSYGRSRVRTVTPEEEVSYVIQFFEQARIFMSMLAADGGGLIYVIG